SEIAHSVLGEKRQRKGERTSDAGFRRSRQLSCSARALEERGPHRTGPSNVLARGAHARQGKSSGDDVRPPGIGRALRRRTSREVVPSLYLRREAGALAHAAIQGQARRSGELARTRERKTHVPRSVTKSSSTVSTFVGYCP